MACHNRNQVRVEQVGRKIKIHNGKRGLETEKEKERVKLILNLSTLF